MQVSCSVSVTYLHSRPTADMIRELLDVDLGVEPTGSDMRVTGALLLSVHATALFVCVKGAVGNGSDA
jgi:hypothetical protein